MNIITNDDLNIDVSKNFLIDVSNVVTFDVDGSMNIITNDDLNIDVSKNFLIDVSNVVTFDVDGSMNIITNDDLNIDVSKNFLIDVSNVVTFDVDGSMNIITNDDLNIDVSKNFLIDVSNVVTFDVDGSMNMITNDDFNINASNQITFDASSVLVESYNNLDLSSNTMLLETSTNTNDDNIKVASGAGGLQLMSAKTLLLSTSANNSDIKLQPNVTGNIYLGKTDSNNWGDLIINSNNLTTNARGGDIKFINIYDGKSFEINCSGSNSTINLGTNTASVNIGNDSAGALTMKSGNDITISPGNSNEIIMDKVNITSGSLTNVGVTIGTGMTFDISNGTLTTSDSQRQYIFQNCTSNLNIGNYNLTAGNFTVYENNHVADGVMYLGTTSTTSTSAGLTNYNKLTTSANFKFTDTSTDGGILNVTGKGIFSGNVGIGTSNPKRHLHIHDTGAAYLQLTTNDTGFDGFQIICAKDSYSGTPDAYIVNHEPGNLRFSTSNTERMRIDPSGNVGIGNTNPAALLSVGDDSDTIPFVVGSYSAVNPPLLNIRSRNYNNDCSIAHFSRGDSIFQFSATGFFHKWGDSGNIAAMITRSNHVYFGNQTQSSWIEFNIDKSIRFQPGNTEKMCIEDGGNVGIGTTTPGAKLDVNGDIYCDDIYCNNSLQAVDSQDLHLVPGSDTRDVKITRGDLNVEYGGITANGQIQAGSFNATSDIRLKENIVTLENSLDIINNIRGVKYNWKSDKTLKKHCGVIAQEIEEHIPEAVNKSQSEDKYSVDYNTIIGHLIESVKELKKQNDTMKLEIEELRKVK